MEKETRSFQAETKQLLDLMIHSIYTHREIFLRELISNASDAIDKIKFQSLTDTSILEGNSDFEIKISFNKEDRTIKISDNGIGMSYNEVIDHIGTIAKSGSKAFSQALKEKNQNNEIDIIGQFGVGFYSAFMVAKKVTLITKAPNEEKGVMWESTGDGSYSIEYHDKPARGTDIIIHLRDNEGDSDFDEYLSQYKLESLIKKYSDYIRYPVKLQVTEEIYPKDENGKVVENSIPEKKVSWKTVNSMTPIWRKDRNSITKEEYTEFYKSKFHDWNEPLETIHTHVDGSIEYDALLFIPEKAPFDFYSKDFAKGLQLYCKNVFIMQNCAEIIPDYLGFIKGLVDSPDFSLNISREILQQNRQLEIISKNIEKKILSSLKEMLKSDREKYIKFFKEFGVALKNGIYSDFLGKNKEKIEDLLLFTTSTSEKEVTLEEYVSRMKENQDKIYYVSGDDRTLIEKLPQMERLKEKDIEVLYLFEKIDEFVLERMIDYKGKKFQSITKGELDILNSEETKKAIEEKSKDNEKMLEKIKELLKDSITNVRLTSKLKSTPACVVTDDHGISLEMEKIISEMPNMKNFKASRILELNPDHAIFTVLQDAFNNNKEEDLKELSQILYYQSLLSEGLKIEDPFDFVQKINSLIIKTKV